MAIVDQTLKPLAAIVTSAQPHEITLLQEAILIITEHEDPLRFFS
jgi:hypothetical protein